jgi:ribulose-phosphate 3-epimerase
VSTRAVEIAPSILSADFLRLGTQVSDALEAGVRRIHVDIMDGHFVPNLSMGPLVVSALRPLAERAGAILEVHLMIAEPDRYLDAFRHAGATAMTVHIEACPHLHRTVGAIRGLAAQPGVAINPATPVAALEEILPDVDVALVMSVDPGFGGQAFIPGTIGKVARLRAELVRRGLEHVEIEVDGGVEQENIRALAEAGMTIAVAGTSVFDARAPIGQNVRALRAACGVHARRQSTPPL